MNGKMEYQNTVECSASVNELTDIVFRGEPYLPRPSKPWYDRGLYDDSCYVHVENILNNLRRVMVDGDFSNDEVLARLFDSEGYVAIEFFTNVLKEYYVMIGLHKCQMTAPTMDDQHAHYIHALSVWSQTDEEGSSCFLDADDKIMYVNDMWFKLVKKGQNSSERPETEYCTMLHETYKSKSVEFQSMLENHYDVVINSLPGFLASFRPRKVLQEHADKCKECIAARLDHIMECVRYSRADGKVLVHADLSNIMLAIRKALKNGRIEWNRRRRS